MSSGELLQLTLSTISSDVWPMLKQSWETDVTLQTIIANLKLNPASHPHYKWHNDELRRNGKLVAGNSLPLQQMLLSWFHNSSHGGHSGINATLT